MKFKTFVFCAIFVVITLCVDETEQNFPISVAVIYVTLFSDVHHETCENQ